MQYPLTQYSHGAGCGCKISPQVLTQILGDSPLRNLEFPGLLVGNDHRDDAAVFDLGDGSAVISTTDFFMPIVDDAETFGHIASVNAISDVYAMGGKPILAIAILGWPVDKLPPEVAHDVIEGARAACAKAGIPLAGGHSIDSPEPIFGLAVTGRVAIEHLKKNAGAQPGDIIYLTKPLGIGVFSTAQKKGLLAPEHYELACVTMMQLNDIGAQLGEIPGVHAMTDVTGFGLAGHLIEVCEAGNVHASIDFTVLPLLNAEALMGYLDQKCVPGGTHRNFSSYGSKVQVVDETQNNILCDPQTSGGLLIAVAPESAELIQEILDKAGLYSTPIGSFVRSSVTAPTLQIRF
jgi:selenide,water dikinase